LLILLLVSLAIVSIGGICCLVMICAIAILQRWLPLPGSQPVTIAKPETEKDIATEQQKLVDASAMLLQRLRFYHPGHDYPNEQDTVLIKRKGPR
jgi:hypothetical protein